MFNIIVKTAFTALLLQSTFAHPGHDGTAEMKERAAYMTKLRNRDLSHCATAMEESGLTRRIKERREEYIRALRMKRGLRNGKSTFSSRVSTINP